MAGYVITTDRDKVFSQLARIKKDFPKYKIIEDVGERNWCILFFQKINIENACNIFTKGENFIIGTGIYIYHGKTGVDALELIYDEFAHGNQVFGNVIGHFNFIIFQNGKLQIVTDKTGYYFSYYGQDQKRKVYSTSLLTLSNLLDTLEPAKQELQEYINIAATIGGNTIFNNIKHNEAGCIIDVEQENFVQYFSRDVPAIELKNFVQLVDSYFDNLVDIDFSIGADLSGGFDTRTVAASLLRKEMEFDFLTNDRPKEISRDKEVSIYIAKRFNKNIKVIPLEYSSHKNYKKEEIVSLLDGARGIDISKRVLNEINNKSENHDLIIGGWGAELLRNQHGRYNSFEKTVRGYGYYRVPLANKNEYFDNLLKKIVEDIGHINKPSYVSDSELAYYYEKSRFWTGSVLSARNKFAYWLFPFSDPIIALPLLGLENKGSQLQRDVIVGLFPKFLGVKFGNESPDNYIVSIANKIIKRLKANKHFGKGMPKGDYNQNLVYSDNPALKNITGIDIQYLKDNKCERSLAKHETLSVVFNMLNIK